MRDYREDAVIDSNNLDFECERNPSLFSEWGDIESEAKDEERRLERKIEVVKAEVGLKYKRMTSSQIQAKYGLNLSKGLTDAVLKMLIEKDPDVEKVYEEYFVARNNASRAFIARKTFEQKKDMLEGLIKLHGQGYFGEINSNEYKERRLDSIRKKRINEGKTKKDKNNQTKVRKEK